MASFDLPTLCTAAALLAGAMAARAETGSDRVYATVPDAAFPVVAEIRAKRSEVKRLPTAPETAR
ncbi:hypothetical protein [Methylobacterium sp. PvR107]|uniref:hypothetical protein n=1 Tax=Methylobacterium sp. PvR107 TaxID=2806597 RepID=UPI001AE51CA8|nr:hypothetical protein [Methylobacterium sp. PvR107]MBP1182242.1 hypothetical protein [Methylobacterium sp. PvR107]